MSIASQLVDLNNIKQDIKQAITDRGVTVSNDMTEYANAIDQIPVVKPNYLTFTSQQNSSSVWLQIDNGGEDDADAPNCEYSYDKENWATFPTNSSDAVNLDEGDVIYLRGVNPDHFSLIEEPDFWLTSKFIMSGSIAASGSVMSLVDGTGTTDIIPNTHYGYFYELFADCTSLTAAPELPATTLADGCYSYMFLGCTALIAAPELPATTLEFSCYSYMFSGCTSLTTAPKLPATTLTEECYLRMFDGCTSLTTAPELPATTLERDCYAVMFAGCSNLSYVKCLATNMTAVGCTGNWLSNAGTSVVGDKVFVQNQSAVWPVETSGIPEGWTIAYPDIIPSSTTIVGKPGDELVVKAPAGKLYDSVTVTGIRYNYLTFTSQQDGSSVWLSIEDNSEEEIEYPNCEYSFDANNWTDFPTSEDDALILNSGDTIYIRGVNPEYFSYKYIDPDEGMDVFDLTVGFVMSGSIAASGSVMSLVDGTGETDIIPASEGAETDGNGNYFQYLFANCTALTTAPELPATTLAPYCYYGMFSGCTSLTTAPELPAAVLKWSCYTNMFEGCTSLTTAPKLPATTLANSCCYEMFKNCTSLTTAPKLPAAVLDVYCYHGMFTNCTSLTTAPGLPATILDSYCYYSMFYGCTALTTAPELPATSLAQYCYGNMFKNCTSLTTAPELPVTALAGSCYSGMFTNCTSLTAAPELPATTLADGCYSGMFSGCTSLTTVPELPATALPRHCYDSMFSGCTSLTTVPELPATTLAPRCYLRMFSGCTALTTAPELPATTLKESCYDSMFSGCTALTTAPELPAATLTPWCYRKLFEGCGNLSYVKCLATNMSAADCTKDWLSGTGTSVVVDKVCVISYSARNTWATGVSGIPSDWIKEPNLLKFKYEGFIDGTSYSNPLMVYLKTGSTGQQDCKYTTNWEDDNSWVNFPTSQADAIEMGWGGTIDTGVPTIYLKGTNPNGFSSMIDVCTYIFVETADCGNIQVSGNIMSLIDGVGETKIIPNSYCFYNLFEGCTSLTTAPELPATTLAGSCYYSMFEGCTSLTSAPKLPATTLVDGCYDNMFWDCTSLTSAPKLPATTLAESCYSGMFYNCSSLTTAPELPATTLTDDCYHSMFEGCTSLTTAPELPATTLTFSCYYRMFYGCTSLTTAPELPATTLTPYCYYCMFYRCTSLTTAPELPAATLVEGCYESMFSECTSLNLVKCFADSWGLDDPMSTVLDGFLPRSFQGDLYIHGRIINASAWSGSIGMPQRAIIHYLDSTYMELTQNEYDAIADKDFDTIYIITNDYLCFKAVGGNTTVGLNSKASLQTIEYSFDKIKWTRLTTSSSVLLYDGCRMYLRGTLTGDLSGGDYTNFYMNSEENATVEASGDCTYLWGSTMSSHGDANYQSCGGLLFSNCTSLIKAPELPATTLADLCYDSMFKDCTSLIKAPELPATTLKSGCYTYMFSGCTTLSTAPDLPATTLEGNCYDSMFKDCENLSYIKCLATNVTSGYYTTNWLSNAGTSVTGDKIFVKDSSTTWPTSDSGIPTGWIIQDAS